MPVSGSSCWPAPTLRERPVYSSGMENLLLPAALAATLSLAACGGSTGHQVQTGPAPTPGPSEGAQIARTDSLRRPYTEADIRFMTDMIGHHSQAITMSGWAPSHGADASI